VEFNAFGVFRASCVFLGDLQAVDKVQLSMLFS